MIGAGILGGPGSATSRTISRSRARANCRWKGHYDRYMARNERSREDEVPIVSTFLPTQVPPIAGIDNSKFKVFEDYRANLAKMEQDKSYRLVSPGIDGLKAYMTEVDRANQEKKEPPKVLLTTLDSDLVVLLRLKKDDKPVEPKLEQNLTKLKEWWDKDGRPNYDADKVPLVGARLYGAKPPSCTRRGTGHCTSGSCSLLLVFIFAGAVAKQVHAEEPEGPTEY